MKRMLMLVGIGIMIVLVSGVVFGETFTTYANYSTNFYTSNPPNWVTIIGEHESNNSQIQVLSQKPIGQSSYANINGTEFGLMTTQDHQHVPSYYKVVANYSEMVIYPHNALDPYYNLEEDTDDMENYFILHRYAENDAIPSDNRIGVLVEKEVFGEGNNITNHYWVYIKGVDSNGNDVSELVWNTTIKGHESYLETSTVGIQYTILNTTPIYTWTNFTIHIEISVNYGEQEETIAKDFSESLSGILNADVNEMLYKVYSETTGMAHMTGLLYAYTLTSGKMSVKYNTGNIRSGGSGGSGSGNGTGGGSGSSGTGGSGTSPPSNTNNGGNNNWLWWLLLGGIGIAIPVVYIWHARNNVCCL